MGQCYTFNSGADGAELLTTPKGGMGNGLEIMLDVQQDEYLPVWRDMGMGPTGQAGSVAQLGYERLWEGEEALGRAPEHIVSREKGAGFVGHSPGEGGLQQGVS